MSGDSGKPSNGQRRQPVDPRPNGPRSALAWLVLTAVLFLLFPFLLARDVTEATPYSAVKTMIRDGQVESAILEEHAIIVTAPDETGTPRQYRAALPNLDDPELLPLLEAQGIEITGREPQGISFLGLFLPWAPDHRRDLLASTAQHGSARRAWRDAASGGCFPGGSPNPPGATGVSHSAMSRARTRPSRR